MITVMNQTNDPTSTPRFIQLLHVANRIHEQSFRERLFATPVFEGETGDGWDHLARGYGIEDYPEAWILYLADAAAFFPKNVRAFDTLKRAYKEISGGDHWEDQAEGQL